MSENGRPKLKRPLLDRNGGGRYFENPTAVEFIPTGCRLLDRVLGNGWAQGRVGNIVGDKSVGKSLAMIEACANFNILYPDKEQAPIRYQDAEAAFDIPYAKTVGLPDKRVVVPEDRIETVEEWFDDLEAFCDKVENVQRTKNKTKGDTIKPLGKPRKAGLYILDSVDSLSDAEEMENGFGKASYGGKKPKLIGQLFRRLIRRMERLNVTLLLVSQTRDKIGVTFGETVTRSGGKALDFYASQIVWLSNLGQRFETRGGVKRPVGVDVRAKCKKNKVGLAWRECDFHIRYAYGIDEFGSALDWLNEMKMLPRFNGLTDKGAKEYLKKLDGMDREQLAAERGKLNAVIDSCWWEVEKRFLPSRSKY